ncbi:MULTISPECIES: hypothetical protein [Sphingobium]|uniref:Uncharacterized protein n=2 Tax=Sphingobium TaxID=165695 RepID=A0A9X7YAL3_SPHYA|nr:hypothetical protein [Sphingobium yanoikuyae]QNG43449.1 hypothetical protein H3V42_15770 [Sphingobium yanoikuyae]
MSSYSPTDPFADPGIATAEDGHVILEGPGGIAITMTAEAAIATGQSLIEAGEQARKVIESD